MAARRGGQTVVARHSHACGNLSGVVGPPSDAFVLRSRDHVYIRYLLCYRREPHKVLVHNILHECMGWGGGMHDAWWLAAVLVVGDNQDESVSRQ